MAAAVSARPASTTPAMTKSVPNPLQSSVNGNSSSIPAISPTLKSRATPNTSTNPPKSGAAAAGTLPQTNGPLPRTRPRPRLSNARALDKGGINGEGDPGSSLKEPYVRTTEFILRKFQGKTPSLILHLYPTYFRFDQQDGTFGYNSPMKFILEHLRQQTVPHDILEELLRGNVPFYDGCLIVEVHDHKTMRNIVDNTSTNGGDLNGQKAFSIHNYNRFITPSPYQPFPRDADSASSRPSSSKENTKEDQNKPAAPTAAAAATPKERAKKPKVFTTVLHPTPQSLHKEVTILASLPAADPRNNKRQQSSLTARDGSNPLATVPSTPLSAVPGTPAPGSKQSPTKRLKMMLEENDIHNFEASVLLYTNPSLLLDPVEDFEASQRVLDMLKDPLHDNAPVRSKARKRTHAELAADEAHAAEEERIALIMDERLEPTLSVNGTSAGADGRANAQFQPDFARFKMIEDIKRNMDEEKKREALASVQKREANEAEKRRQQQENAAMNARREQENSQAAQAQAQAAQAAQAAQTAQAQARAQQQRLLQAQMQQQGQQQRPGTQNGQPNNVGPGQNISTPQSATQPPQGSPVPGTQAQMHSSPLPNAMFNQTTQPSAGGMSATSNAGSPPRPGSAMPAPQPMARGQSKQSHHSLSRTSTPQIPNATPQMANRNITPQPRPGNQQPMFSNSNNPSPALMQHLQNMTPEQRQAFMATQQQRALHRAQAQHAMQGSPNLQPNQLGNQMSPQQPRPGTAQQQAAMEQQRRMQQARAQQMQQMQQTPQGQGFNNMNQGQQMSPQGATPNMGPNMSRNPSQMMQGQMSQQGSPMGPGQQGMQGQNSAQMMSMTPQQQQQMLMQRQKQQAIQASMNQGVPPPKPELKQQFMNQLIQRQGQLPPNAEAMFMNWWSQNWRRQQEAMRQNMLRAQLQGQGGNAGGQGMGNNQGNQGGQGGQGNQGMMNGNVVPASSNQTGANMMQPGEGMTNAQKMQMYNNQLRQSQLMHRENVRAHMQSQQQKHQQGGMNAGNPQSQQQGGMNMGNQGQMNQMNMGGMMSMGGGMNGMNG